MVSCTEFIPFYSEFFKYLEDKNGKEEVIRYWEFISDTFVKELLGEKVNWALKVAMNIGQNLLMKKRVVLRWFWMKKIMNFQ